MIFILLRVIDEFQTTVTLSGRYYQSRVYKQIFRVHMKHYWHFDGVTPKQYQTLFQTPDDIDIFKELLANNDTHFSRVYIKQYWNFLRVPSKLNYSENFFQSLYHTILTLSDSCYQTIWSFDPTKNKLDCYRDKDCMERFCRDLKEHATRLTKFEKKNYTTDR